MRRYKARLPRLIFHSKDTQTALRDRGDYFEHVDVDATTLGGLARLDFFELFFTAKTSSQLVQNFLFD